MTNRQIKKRLKRMKPIAVPEALNRRMDRLFNEFGSRLETPGDVRATEIRRGRDPRHSWKYWRAPAWIAAAACLVVALFAVYQTAIGPRSAKTAASPAPLEIDIRPSGSLERFLSGATNDPGGVHEDGRAASTELALFMRGNCSVKTVYPLDAPAWVRDDRRVN